MLRQPVSDCNTEPSMGATSGAIIKMMPMSVNICAASLP